MQTSQTIFRRSAFGAALLCSTVVLAGCQTIGFGTDLGVESGRTITTHAQGGMVDGYGSVEATTLANQALAALAKGDFETASTRINAALRLDITNARLQFLNGLTYHMMALEGDSTKLDMAEQGYTLALKFDPGNVLVKRHLARLYMEQERFAQAEGLLAGVAVYHHDDPDVLYDLAVAAYYNHDPETAEAALSHLAEVAPERAHTPAILRARAMVMAALDDTAAAEKALDGLRRVAPDSSEVDHIERRIRNWADFYTFDAHTILAQYNPYGTDATGGDPAPDAAAPEGDAGTAAGGDFADGKMVVVDVVLIGTQSDVRDTRGVNLLNGLQLQFGDPVAGTSAFRYGIDKSKAYIDPTLSTSTQTITGLISIPAVTYSLNIANNSDAQNQILAKPSLVAQAGQTSEFFSGTEITAAAVSGGAGDSVSVQKEVGVKLAVTPEFLPDDKIRLHVVAERTFLTDPSNSVVFQFRLDTSKTNINSTVTLNYGETLILGGLSERETSDSSDAVPVLGQIPLVDLFFNARAKRRYERSILVLLTPRRAEYAHQSETHRKEAEGKMSDFERDLERLHRRYRDWFTPRPTFNEVIDGIQGREFFHEFKTGDVKVGRWFDPKTLGQRVARLRTEMED